MKTANCIKTSLFFIFCFLQIYASFAEIKQNPNILIIIVDQQFADAMSCVMGNEYINTPNMDLLVEKGVRFTKAYSPNPLCMPMRTSMFSGRYPHETGVLTNDKTNTLSPGKNVFMGKILQ